MQTGVDHDENFPVASWLCPPRLRPVIAAIYHFARTADDIADEGPAPAQQRLADLARYRRLLDWAAQPDLAPWPDPTASDRWHTVFATLRPHLHAWSLPLPCLHALLDAFEQDVRRTASGQVYQTVDELLDYCQRSANPVGRLLLHLYGVNDAVSLTRSDAICTALQLINFWQDISIDWPRQRHYLPADVLGRHGLTLSDFAPPRPDRPTTTAADMEARRCAAVAELVNDAAHRMHQGAPLALALPGRMGWELRLVVQGGLRIAERIGRLNHRTWAVRPQLKGTDVPLLLWRAACMKADELGAG